MFLAACERKTLDVDARHVLMKLIVASLATRCGPVTRDDNGYDEDRGLAFVKSRRSDGRVAFH